VASVALASSNAVSRPIRVSTSDQSVFRVVAERPASTAQFTGLNLATDRTQPGIKVGGMKVVERKVTGSATDDRRRVLVELTPLTEQSVYPLYEPLFQGSIELLKDRTDKELQVMIDFLERGREMVEKEIEQLERKAD
jgi:hypothetical protein